ncbi:MAG: nitroreductase family protein [Planctomycetota bacterium]|jgi:nitroreductase
MTEPGFLPLEHREYPAEEMQRRADDFYTEIRRRRSVRQFSDRPVPREVIESCLRAAGTAPSGANRQPWHFVAVADRAVKRRLREAAEAEERAFYGDRAPEEWLFALKPLGTGPEKPFLETAPYLIVVFVAHSRPAPDGTDEKTYYPVQSVGLAAGLLLAALHHAGLASLVYTPSRMGFLNELLERPPNERPFVVVVTGYPAADAKVPAIDKKSLAEIATFV